jgi:Flp pilus assembly CpaF family ATPase
MDELRAAARVINARLGDCVRESAERAGEGTVTLSHLVERDALTMYMDRIRAMEVRAVGPSAPYSFGPPE